MPYEEGYEMNVLKTAAREETPSLGMKLQELHKLLAQHDDFMDTLYGKADALLLPSNPTPMDEPGMSVRQAGSPYREEIQNVINRLIQQNMRVRHFIDRLDV